MKRYKFTRLDVKHTLDERILERLNEYGREGWMLVKKEPGECILMKEIEHLYERYEQVYVLRGQTRNIVRGTIACQPNADSNAYSVTVDGTNFPYLESQIHKDHADAQRYKDWLNKLDIRGNVQKIN